jgi:hypothetical protein
MSPSFKRVIVVHPRIRLELGENLDVAAKPDVDRHLSRPKCRLLNPDSIQSSENAMRFGTDQSQVQRYLSERWWKNSPR